MRRSETVTTSHAIRPMRTTTLQIPAANRQPPDVNVAIGPVAAAETVLPTDKAVPYTPISNAARPAKRALMKPAIRAPATAIPIPTPAVAVSKVKRSNENARPTVAAAKSVSANSSTRSLPSRRASHGAGNANTPISRSGIDVKSEACAWERPNASMMSGRIGPTETREGRSPRATRMIAVIAKGAPIWRGLVEFESCYLTGRSVIEYEHAPSLFFCQCHACDARLFNR